MSDRFNTSIIARFCAVVMCHALVSCANDADKFQDFPQTEVMRLTFKVSTDLPSSSRAGTWGDGYESDPAYDFEKKIRTIEAYLYDNSNRLITRLETDGSTAASDELDFILRIDSNSKWLNQGADGKRYLSGKLVVTANCDGLSGNALEKLRFSRDANNAPTNDSELRNSAIPMWGCCILTDIPIIPNSHYPAEGDNPVEIHLLRAMAKVTVSLSEKVRETYKLTGATLSSYQLYGNVVPNGAADIAGTTGLDIDRCFNPEPDRMITSPYPLTPFTHTIRDSSGKTVTVTDLIGYIPEIDNPGRDILHITPQIADNKGNPINADGDDFRIYFTEYTDGQPSETVDKDHDIIRNHSYIFTINSITMPYVDYTVCKWDDREADDIIFD